MVLRGTARRLSAVAEGGAQTVEWPDAGSEMMLTGPAEIVCAGEAYQAVHEGAAVEI
jgi:diaminopimelate epimerase